MRRKKYTLEFKEQVIKEAIEVGNSAIVARRHDIGGGLVARWVREFKNGKYKANGGNNQSQGELAKESQNLSYDNICLIRWLLRHDCPGDGGGGSKHKPGCTLLVGAARPVGCLVSGWDG